MKKHWTTKLKEDLLLAKQQRNALYKVLKRRGNPDDLNMSEVKVYMETGMEIELENQIWNGSSSAVTVIKNN